MDDREEIKQRYEKMCSAMIKKDREALENVLDDSYVLVHMTGMRQSKSEFINAVMDGTLNYYSAVHESESVDITGDTAVVVGRSYVQLKKDKRKLKNHTKCGFDILRRKL